MNPIALTHLIAAGVSLGLAIPLIKRRVPMNRWYGIRIRRAFESEQRWYSVNEYGGRALAYWSAFIALVGAAGLMLGPNAWPQYAMISTILLLLSLVIVVIAITRHAKRAA